LFGWDLETLFLAAHQKRCQAFLSAGKPVQALEAHKYMMETIDKSAKAGCLVWSNGKSAQECSALCAANVDAAPAASGYDRAIDLYSAAITLYSASSTVFANRSKAKLGKMLWIEALHDAQKVRWHLSFHQQSPLLWKAGAPCSFSRAPCSRALPNKAKNFDGTPDTPWSQPGICT
ncbi:hypothetical protein CY34DRAFT_92552, partial [Suillus luteus UH-Slu-Lm8-n1]